MSASLASPKVPRFAVSTLHVVPEHRSQPFLDNRTRLFHCRRTSPLERRRQYPHCCTLWIPRRLGVTCSGLTNDLAETGQNIICLVCPASVKWRDPRSGPLNLTYRSLALLPRLIDPSSSVFSSLPPRLVDCSPLVVSTPPPPFIVDSTPAGCLIPSPPYSREKPIKLATRSTQGAELVHVQTAGLRLG